MKKLLSIAVAALASAAIAETVDVATVGITAVSTTLENTIVAVPFESLRGITAGTIAVQDVVKTDGLPPGTILYAYDNGSYYAWGIDNGAWVPASTVTKDTPTPTSAPGATTYTVSTGSAIWLCLPAAPSGSQTFYLYGQYVAPGSVAFAAGRNLVANTTQEAVNNLASRIIGAQKGDRIIAPNGTEYTYGRKGWVSGGSNPVLGLPPIAAGQGFWYIANSAGSINWGTIE